MIERVGGVKEAVDLKVLIVSPLPPPYGGISHWTAMVTAYAADERPDVSLRVLDTAPRTRGELVPTVSRRVYEGVSRLVSDSVRFVRELTIRRPDVVHLNTSGHLAFVRDIVLLGTAKLFRVPVVYHLRFGRLPTAARDQTWEWRLASVALRLASAVIALDDRTAVCAKSAVRSSLVHQFPNPLHPLVLGGAPAPARRNVVLYVGWLIRTKGIEELLSVWDRLKLRDWELELAGPVDGDYLNELRRRGLLRRVNWLGPLSHADVLSLMRTSAVFAFPSHTEGFPNAVAEAMASGMPVVGSNVGAIPTMLGGGAGLVVPAKDELGLERALSDLVGSPELRTSLGEAARMKAESEYAISNVFDAYVKLWRLVSTPKGDQR